MKLKDIKAQPINLLSGNRITTFDKKNNQVIVYKVDDISFESEIACDEKTLNMLKFMYQNEGYKLEIIGNTINIVTKTSSFKATILSEIIIPELTNTGLIEIKANLTALKKATKFVSKSDTKPVLTGVFLQENGKVLSTDSYKAYLYNPGDLPAEDKPKQYVIPTWFIDAIQADEEEVEIKVSPFTATYENEDMTVYTNLIIGDIQFEHLFDSRTTSELRINKADISKELSIFASLTDKNAVIEFNVSKLDLTLTSKSELNAYETVITLESGFDTNGILTGFLLEYLQTIIASCDELINVRYSTALSPFNIKSGNDRFILLPVKI